MNIDPGDYALAEQLYHQLGRRRAFFKLTCAYGLTNKYANAVLAAIENAE